MQPEHIHNRLRLCLGFRRIYEQTEMLGMQPELLCPRRSRFAPKFAYAHARYARSSKLPGEILLRRSAARNFTGQAKLELQWCVWWGM